MMFYLALFAFFYITGILALSALKYFAYREENKRLKEKGESYETINLNITAVYLTFWLFSGGYSITQVL